MIKRNNKTSVFMAFLIGLNTLSAQVISPFNKLSVNDTNTTYSFLVSGHFHGASTNISTYPASTLLANLDTLNALNPSFLISLGDMFLDVNETNIDHYQKSLFDKLKMPLFNAVGNHDLSNGNVYEKVYGKTFFSFTHQSELFIVLNTELNDGSIKNEQLEFLKDILNTKKIQSLKNIFIFSHRPIWAEQIEKYKNLFKGNTRSSFVSNNFVAEVYPLLQTISFNKKIYWLSGSMGGGPASFFYDRDKKSNITFMQTAIRDLPHDAMLLINSVNGKISFNGISLTGQKLKLIENYNLSYWSATGNPEEKFNFRLLPYKSFLMITHHYFLIGFVSGILLILLIALIRKRWARKK